MDKLLTRTDIRTISVDIHEGDEGVCIRQVHGGLRSMTIGDLKVLKIEGNRIVFGATTCSGMSITFDGDALTGDVKYEFSFDGKEYEPLFYFSKKVYKFPEWIQSGSFINLHVNTIRRKYQFPPNTKAVVEMIDREHHIMNIQYLSGRHYSGVNHGCDEGVFQHVRLRLQMSTYGDDKIILTHGEDWAHSFNMDDIEVELLG